MLLFKKRFFEGLLSGAITLTFRQWEKPHVKPGGRYRCHPIGVLLVDAVEPVRWDRVTTEDARSAGFSDRAEMHGFLEAPPFGKPVDDASVLFRVQLRHAGDGDRLDIAMDETLSDDDVETIRATLEKLDQRSPHGAWTGKVLKVISQHPRVAASKLATRLKRETVDFKVDVRKLKKLGLTQSFEVGYEVSPRGRAYLARSARL